MPDSGEKAAYFATLQWTSPVRRRIGQTKKMDTKVRENEELKKLSNRDNALKFDEKDLFNISYRLLLNCVKD